MLFWIGLAAVALLAYAALRLILPILWPRIHGYPWRLPSDYRQKQREKKMTVVLAGSYNPPHRGHFAMISHLSERYGAVIVVVGMNAGKTYAVTPDERAALLRTILKTLPNVRVEVVSGYIWRFAKERNVRVFFRGIRSWEKDGHEERHLQILNTWGPLLLGPLWWPIPTRFLEGKPDYSHISSTLIRDICSKPDFNVQDIHDLVPESIAEQVMKFYGPRQ
jgi:pantetheine-phosphate adenylyltransferase